MRQAWKSIKICKRLLNSTNIYRTFSQGAIVEARTKNLKILECNFQSNGHKLPLRHIFYAFLTGLYMRSFLFT